MASFKSRLSAFTKALNSKEYSVIILDVCPGLAREMLKLNTNNRSLSKAKTKQYVEHLMNDDWVEENGQSITFDKDKILVGGQHRLMAITQSGKAMRNVIIATGADPRAKLVNDVLRPKTSNDIVCIDGSERKPKEMKAALTGAIVRQVVLGLRGSYGAIPPFRIARYARELRDGLDFAYYEAFAQKRDNANVAIAPVMAVAVRAFYARPKRDRKKIKEFFDALCTGISPGNQNLIQLRDFIRPGVGKRNGKEVMAIYRNAEAYLFDFLEGGDCSQIRATSVEHFPIWLDAKPTNHLLVDIKATGMDESKAKDAILGGKIRLAAGKKMASVLAKLHESDRLALVANGNIIGMAIIKDILRQPRHRKDKHPYLLEIAGDAWKPLYIDDEVIGRTSTRARKDGALILSQKDFEAIVGEPVK